MLQIRVYAQDFGSTNVGAIVERIAEYTGIETDQIRILLVESRVGEPSYTMRFMGPQPTRCVILADIIYEEIPLAEWAKSSIAEVLRHFLKKGLAEEENLLPQKTIVTFTSGTQIIEFSD